MIHKLYFLLNKVRAGKNQQTKPIANLALSIVKVKPKFSSLNYIQYVGTDTWYTWYVSIKHTYKDCYYYYYYYY